MFSSNEPPLKPKDKLSAEINIRKALQSTKNGIKNAFLRKIRVMKNRKKLLEQIRRWEAELVYATPSRAAKLTGKIVKGKAEVFD